MSHFIAHIQSKIPWRLFFSLSPFIDNFGDCMSDSDPSPLNFLFRKTGGDADLQGRLKLPSDVLTRRVDCSRHTLEPRDQYTIGQCLRKVNQQSFLHFPRP